EVSVEGTQSDTQLLLNLTHDGEVIAARRLTLRNGRGFAVFPYDSRFTGKVTIAALSLTTMKSRYNYPWGATVVLFPKKRRLGLQVHLDKDTYRPGQDASAQFAVKMPDGAGAESALGIKIVDQSVEERARMDTEFGSGHWSSWRYWDEENDSDF